MNIKRFIADHFTATEQKAVFFLLFIICLGSILHLFSCTSQNKGIVSDESPDLSELMDNDYIHRYDLLSATTDDLQYIEGIGPALSRRIVEYQTEVGFTKVDDLLSIRGIGNTRYNEYKEFFYVGDADSDSDTTMVISPPPPPPHSQAHGGGKPTPHLLSGDGEAVQKININTATQEELTILKGIGPVKASEIINYRNKNRFTKIDEIINVKGIGPKTYEQIKDFITVGE